MSLKIFLTASSLKESWEVWYNLGVLYEKFGNLEYAQYAYEHVLTLNPLPDIS